MCDKLHFVDCVAQAATLCPAQLRLAAYSTVSDKLKFIGLWCPKLARRAVWLIESAAALDDGYNASRLLNSTLGRQAALAWDK